MADNRDTVQKLMNHLVLAVQPLRRATADLQSFQTFMLQLGWETGSLPPQYSLLANGVTDAVNAADALGASPGLEEIISVVQKVGDVYRAVQAINVAPAGVDAGTFLSEIGQSLFEYLLVEYLASATPDFFTLLEMLGIIVHEEHEATANRPSFVRTRLLYDQIPQVLTDPLDVPRRIYGWGSQDIDFDLLAEHLLELAVALSLPSSLRMVDRLESEGFASGSPANNAKSIDLALEFPIFEVELAGRLRPVGLQVLELPAESSQPAGIILRPEVPDGLAASIAIDDALTFEIRAGTNLADIFGVVLRPDDIEVRYPLSPGNTLPNAGFGAALHYAPAAPDVLVGRPGASRLDLGGVRAGLVVEFVSGELETRLDIELSDLRAIVSAEDVDGFLRELFGGTDLTVPVQLGLAWSNRTGFSFSGGLGIEVSVYPHLDLGPISIDRLDLAICAGLGMEGPASLNVSAGTALSGELGPLAFSTEGIGVELKFLFQDGNAGPFDVDFGFKPPTSLGIVVDAGPVTGGGFLGFDRSRGRYVGILELSIYEIAISAIGLLDTKTEAGEDLPAPGFSFLIIISVEFTPIQLGFGFTLNGVGGLAGIHRTIVTEALQTGLREGTLDHILFPQDPVRNAPQIVSDLRVVFPVAVGRFVFGPMAKLGWGTPAVITAELGIILEFPDPFRIVILGQGAALLPEDAPIVRIHVDILGIIDFAQGTFSIDASIRDSYVGPYALSGDMAMRLKWSGRPNFAMSVGGLNPNFTPPPNFPTLRRIMVSLGAGDNPRISLQGYFAVTSNSFQVGAMAELYAAAGGFNVYGFLGFDALIIFDPFYFRFDFRAGFALRKGSKRIAGITVKGTLSGPSPYYVKGEGCVSFFFFDVCVPFEATFGRRQQVSLPEKDPWEALSAAIADQRNWTPVLPNGQSAGVTFQPSTEGVLFVHPLGRLSFRQRVVPLNKTLVRFGEFAIRGANRFDIATVEIGDEPAADFDFVEDYMAPGLSEDLSDREKVTRDSFELEVVGVEAGSTRAEFGAARTKIIEYEQKIVETPWRARLLTTIYTIPRAYQLAVATVGAKARSLVAITGRNKFAAAADREQGVQLDDEKWLVVDAETLTEEATFGGAMTKGQAMRAYKTHIQDHPEDRIRLEVVSAFEMEDTA